MDEWIALVNSVKYEPSRVKYYKRFFYCIRIYAPYARQMHIKDKEWSLNSIENKINDILRPPDYGVPRHWNAARIRRLAEVASPCLIKDLNNIIFNNSDITSRIGSPGVSFYCETQEEVLRIVDSGLYIKDAITSISGPINEEHLTALNDGKIIRKKDVGYRFVMQLGYSVMTPETKNQLYNYLVALEDEVMVGRRLLYQLSPGSNSRYMHGGQIHTNDPNLVIFMKLICPEFIRDIKEIALIT